MKISVVIPAFNEQEYLGKTLEAVLAQNYPDFEVIVVNNASTDKTEIVAKSFSKVKVVTETNKGLLFARERGRKEAAGEIIANLDADCLPAPDWLSKAAHYFANPEIIAVTGPYDYYDAGSAFRKFSFATQRDIYRLVNNMMDTLHTGGILIGGNNLIRASALEAAGGYNTSIQFYGEDTDTARRISKLGKIFFSKEHIVKTSARRFKAEGTMKISAFYLYHFLKVGVLPAIGMEKLIQSDKK